MPPEQPINLEFPLAGIDRRAGYSRQKPYTTPHAVNVRPDSAVEGRARGGSRFGAEPATVEMPWVTAAGGTGDPDPVPDPTLAGDAISGPINAMAAVAIPFINVDATTGAAQLHRVFVERFDKPGPFGSNWTAYQTFQLPGSWRGRYAYQDGTTLAVGAVLSSADAFVPIDHTHPWSISIYLVRPKVTNWTKTVLTLYELYLGDPDTGADRISLTVSMSVDSSDNLTAIATFTTPQEGADANDNANFNSKSNIALGLNRSGWLTLYSTGDATAVSGSTGGIVGYFDGIALGSMPWYNDVYPANMSTEIGFNMVGGNEGTDGYELLVESFRAEFFEQQNHSSTLPLEDATSDGQFVATSGTKLYRALYPSVTEHIDTEITGSPNATPTLYGDAPIQSASIDNKVFFADYGPVRYEGSLPITNGGSNAHLEFPEGTLSTYVTNDNRQNWDVEIYDTVDALTASNYIGVYAVTSTASPGGGSPDQLFLSQNTLADTSGSNVHFRIVRSTKQCNLAAARNPLQPLQEVQSGGFGGALSGIGLRPVGCRAIAAYRNRLVLAASPYARSNVYASRVSAPTVFDYDSTVTADTLKSWVEPMWHASGELQQTTCLAPWRNNYLIIGCERSLHVMRGDIGSGGSLNAISRTTGVISPTAWCHLPDGTFFFLSHAGLRFVPPGANTTPEVTASQQLSKSRMPIDLINVHPESTIVLMAYDHLDNGVHIFLTPKMGGVARHWWYSMDHQSFWEDQFASENFNPWSLLNVGGGLLLGCYDGKIRRYNRHARFDDASAISSAVLIGPFALGDGYNDGILNRMKAVLGESSGDVTWELFVGDTAEEVSLRAQYGTQSGFTATADSTGTWSGGDNYRDLAMLDNARGAAAVLKLSSTNAWTMERLIAFRQLAGMSFKL